jgi:outer membrane protein assembly factor BamA
VISTRGDARGNLLQLDEVPLIRDQLHLQLFGMDIDAATVNDYETRGMNSDQEGYNLLELSRVEQRSAALTWSLWERRLALSARYGNFRNEVSAIRDADGDVIARFDSPYVTESTERSLGLLLDLTDDFQDPRDGLRLRLGFQDHPAANTESADFYVVDTSLLYYLPLGTSDTIAFNYYRSDAYVRSTGLLDADAIRTDLGTQCSPADSACLDAEAQRVQNILDERRYGTATTLGGNDRLRSYPDGRFSGAHMAFAGIELRSNFIQETKPFDYFIWKDIQTGIQMSLFAEAGTVAETTDALWDEVRTSYGIGARLITASGSVYRADWATGSEGAEFTVFFFYPWH